MGKKTIDKSRWLTPFMGLHETLRPSKDMGLSLYHGVFLTGIAPSKDVSFIIEELEPSYQMMNQAPVQTLSFQVADRVWAYHCFYAWEKTSYHALETALIDLPDWLKDVPCSVLPRFERPALSCRTSANVITWIGLLYHLAWKHDEPFLSAELEYSDSDIDLGFNAWCYSPAYSSCDPTPLITLAPPQDNALKPWRPFGEERECGAPELVSAYLTTEVLAASMAVAPLLKYLTAEPLPPTSQEPSWKRRPPRKRRNRSNGVSDKQELILRLLALHHGCWKEDGGSIEALSQQGIIDRIKKGNRTLSIPQPTVSRSMTKIFPGGMRQYQDLCDRNTIKSYLEKVCEEKYRERTGYEVDVFDQHQREWR